MQIIFEGETMCLPHLCEKLTLGQQRMVVYNQSQPLDQLNHVFTPAWQSPKICWLSMMVSNCAVQSGHFGHLCETPAKVSDNGIKTKNMTRD